MIKDNILRIFRRLIKKGMVKMKKLNMIIGKKQLIVASLVCILGIAVYLNWQFSGIGTAPVDNGKVSSSKNLGDAQFVDATPTANFLMTVRANRQKSRDEMVDMLNTMLKDDSLSAEERAQITDQALHASKAVETESNIENQVKEKGFNDAVAYITANGINVTVQTDGLAQQQAAQIKEIIIKNTNLTPDKITVTEVR